MGYVCKMFTEQPDGYNSKNRFYYCDLLTSLIPLLAYPRSFPAGGISIQVVGVGIRMISDFLSLFIFLYGIVNLRNVEFFFIQGMHIALGDL